MSDNIEFDIELEERSIKRDPFESAKQKLRTSQENIYEKPEKPYVEIKIPETGKVGDWCIVKFSKKVPFAQLAISQDIQWKKRDKYDLKAKPELVCNAFIIKEAKDVDEIKARWEDIGILQQKETNMLLAGEYMVEARGYSKEAFEETTARRLVQVSK